MQWGWEVFYGLATMIAFGLSLRRGGSIAFAGALIALGWWVQGLFYWLHLDTPFAGNLFGMLWSATLLLLLALLPVSSECDSRRRLTICAALVVQLGVHLLYRRGDLPGWLYAPTLNVFYCLQLAALAWPARKV